LRSLLVHQLDIQLTEVGHGLSDCGDTGIAPEISGDAPLYDHGAGVDDDASPDDRTLSRWVDVIEIPHIEDLPRAVGPSEHVAAVVLLDMVQLGPAHSDPSASVLATATPNSVRS